MGGGGTLATHVDEGMGGKLPGSCEPLENQAGWQGDELHGEEVDTVAGRTVQSVVAVTSGLGVPPKAKDGFSSRAEAAASQ